MKKPLRFSQNIKAITYKNNLMDQKILITGSAGFLGRKMIKLLKDQEPNCMIVGVDIKKDDLSDATFDIDLMDIEAVSNLLYEVSPEYILHFAGIFGTDDFKQIYNTNVLSITSILEAVRNIVPNCVVVMAGSAAEYGRVDEELMPIHENTHCEPVMPYGLSKLLATQTAMYYHRVYDLNVSVARLFQLIGKGVSPSLAPGAFFEQIKNAFNSKNGIVITN